MVDSVCIFSMPLVDENVYLDILKELENTKGNAVEAFVNVASKRPEFFIEPAGWGQGYNGNVDTIKITAKDVCLYFPDFPEELACTGIKASSSEVTVEDVLKKTEELCKEFDGKLSRIGDMVKCTLHDKDNFRKFVLNAAGLIMPYEGDFEIFAVLK